MHASKAAHSAVLAAHRWLVAAFLLLYGVIYGVSLAVLDAHRIVAFEELVGLVLVLGIGFTVLAWISTLGTKPLPVPVHDPHRELAVMLGLLGMIAAYLVWGRGLVDAAIPVSWNAEPILANSLNLLKKLIVFVAVPYAVFRFGFGYRWADFGLSGQALRALWGRQGVAVLVVSGGICAFQYFAGSAAAPIRNGDITGWGLWFGLPLCFLWLVIEVGLVEEFVFRALLQTRLAAFFRSDWIGLVCMAVLFALAHVPGYILRGSADVEALGAAPNPLDALVYGIGVLSIAAFYLGMFWQRTRNLWALMLIHAATDLFPNLNQFIQDWRIG